MGLKKGGWDFSSEQWEKRWDIQTEILAFTEGHWYAVPAEYLRAFVLAEAWNMHGEWME